MNERKDFHSLEHYSCPCTGTCDYSIVIVSEAIIVVLFIIIIIIIIIIIVTYIC
jgi:hypothetical protein